jgi:hypothetical protein
MRSPVIVLTGHELFSPWYVQQTWKDLGGLHQKFAEIPALRLDNLETLADVTQQLYLDLPSVSAQMLSGWHERQA